MATSQFTIYTHADIGGPGLMTGISGSLLAVLNACLVTGYSSKTAAGWTKPLADSGSVYGCFKQASGSMMTLFVNDGNPNATSLGKEAGFTGYQLLTSLDPTGSTVTNAGFGYGQFPLPSQLLTYGRVVVRKSVANTAVGRPWIIAADASTFYLWISTGDTADVYYHVGFGDFYAIKAGNTDSKRCFIYGRNTENSAVGTDIDHTDSVILGARGATDVSISGQPAHYVVSKQSGYGGSTSFCKKGDSTASSGQGHGTPVANPMSGLYACPNPTDNKINISPIWVCEPSSTTDMSLRGRMRGLYQMMSKMTTFTDGQSFSGTGKYSGKTFMIVKYGPNSNSGWVLETSSTIETN